MRPQAVKEIFLQRNKSQIHKKKKSNKVNEEEDLALKRERQFWDRVCSY